MLTILGVPLLAWIAGGVAGLILFSLLFGVVVIGEKGRQLGILTAGKYRINPALFDIVTASTAPQFGLSPEQLYVYRVPADRVGIITALDGRPISAGDLAGPIVAGHGSFQHAQAF